MRAYDAAKRIEWAECIRCGIRRRVHSQRQQRLCKDCKSTLRMLGELDRWLEPGKAA